MYTCLHTNTQHCLARLSPDRYASIRFSLTNNGFCTIVSHVASCGIMHSYSIKTNHQLLPHHDPKKPNCKRRCPTTAFRLVLNRILIVPRLCRKPLPSKQLFEQSARQSCRMYQTETVDPSRWQHRRLCHLQPIAGHIDRGNR